jgi:hypothetical protein
MAVTEIASIIVCSEIPLIKLSTTSTTRVFATIHIDGHMISCRTVSRPVAGEEHVIPNNGNLPFWSTWIPHWKVLIQLKKPQ